MIHIGVYLPTNLVDLPSQLWLVSNSGAELLSMGAADGAQ